MDRWINARLWISMMLGWRLVSFMCFPSLANSKQTLIPTVANDSYGCKRTWLVFFNNQLCLDLWYRAYLKSHEGFGHCPCWSHGNYNRFTVLWLTFVFPSCFRCSRKAMRLSTCLCFSPCKSHATLKPSNHQCFKTTEVTEVYWIILGVAWCGIGDLTWLVTSFRFFCCFFRWT